MSIIRVANVHLETTGTNRIDYSSGFTRLITGGTGGIVINTGGTDKINVSANIAVTGNLILNNKNVDFLLTFANTAAGAAYNQANAANVLAAAAFPNTSGVTFSGYLNVMSGNVGIGTSNAATKLNVFGSASGGISTLTDNTSIVLDMTSNNNFSITLGGSNTFINPTVMNPGQSGVIWISQDNTGSRAPSWSSYWKFPGNTAPTLTSTANAVDAIVYSVRSSTSITAQAILNVG
jgi:hypothetical protein